MNTTDTVFERSTIRAYRVFLVWRGAREAADPIFESHQAAAFHAIRLAAFYPCAYYEVSPVLVWKN